MSQTDLKIYSINDQNQTYIPLGAARGCKQTLDPINTAATFRTINGTLVAFNCEGYDKYTSTISCDDAYPISFDGLWPGCSLLIECIPQLMTPLVQQGALIKLQRKPVQGSIMLHTSENATCALNADDERQIQLKQNEGPGYISYRPILRMIIKRFFTETKEWDGKVIWKVELEEV